MDTTSASDVTFSETLTDLNSYTEADTESCNHLHKAAFVLDALRQENDDLSQSFGTLKNLYEELTVVHQQLQSRYDQLAQERASVESQYQQLCDSWRAELDAKQQQFEDARAQILQPRDLDLIRVQLLEEVEGPFRKKCDALAAEAEAAQSTLAQLRSAYDQLQLQHGHLESSSRAEIDALKASSSSEVRELKLQLAELQGANVRCLVLQQQVSTLERERDQHAHLARQQKDELAELRRERDAAVVAREQVTVLVDRKTAHYKAEVLELHALVEALTRKSLVLQRELDKSTQAQESTHQQLLHQQALAAALQAQLTELQATYAAEQHQAAERQAASEHACQAQFDKLKEQVQQKEQQMVQLQAAHEEQLAEQQEEFGQQQRQQQLQWQAELSDLSNSKAMVEDHLSRLAQDKEELEHELQLLKEKAAEDFSLVLQESEALSSKADAAESLAEALQQQLRQTEVELDAANAELAAGAAVRQQLQQRREELEVLLARAEAKQDALQDTCTNLRDQLAKAKLQLQDAHHAAESRASAAKHTWELEKAALNQEHQQQLSGQQQRHEEQLRQLKKRLKEAKCCVKLQSEEITRLQVQLALLEETGQEGHQMEHVSETSHDAGGLASVQELLAAADAVRKRQDVYLRAAGAEVPVAQAVPRSI